MVVAPTARTWRMDLRTASRKAWLGFSMRCQRSATWMACGSALAAARAYPQHLLAALARLARAGKSLLGPANSFAEYAPEPNPEPKKNGVVWFALNDARPLFTFAGIWTQFRGDRGTKSKPIPGPHLVYGFLTTAPNAIVEPIHPKAMPVILTTDQERDRIATHILAFEGDSHVEWFEGNFQDYEKDKMRRLGQDSIIPHRKMLLRFPRISSWR
jgi:hypothetical protein